MLTWFTARASLDFWLLMAALFAMLFTYSIGVDHEHARRIAEVATLKAQYASALANTEHDARIRLQAAQTRGDVLTAQLLQTESDLQRKSLETSREIKRLTTGRACLDASTVSLLNGTAAAVAPTDMPSAASSLAAADGAAASDTDVATWADLARRQFDTCRAHLDALIDWHTLPAQGAAQ